MPLIKSIITHSLALIALGGLAANPSFAQSAFSRALSVDGTLITYYDIDQRAALLDLLNESIDPRGAMIDDVLKRNAAGDNGLKVTRDQLDAAVNGFLSQSNLPRGEAIVALEGAGVSLGTLERFIETNLLWRDFAQQRFSAQVAQFRQDQSAVALAPRGFIEVSVSEIILPVIPGEEEETRFLMEDLRSENSAAAFAQNAKQFSASPSRPEGGRVGWLRLDTANPVLRTALDSVKVGEVTQVIDIPGGMAIFRLNGQRENTPPPREVAQYTYLRLSNNTASALDDAISKMQRCDDIYRYVHEIDGLRYEFFTQRPSEVPAQIARHLPALDNHEVMRLDPTLGLMLCMRLYASNEVARNTDSNNTGFGTGATLGQEEIQILDRRLNALAAGYLAQLKSRAVIIK